MAGLAVLVVAGSLLVTGPSAAAPDSGRDIGSVSARVDRLYHQAEQASERYDAARIDLHRAQRRLNGLESALRRQRSDVASVRRQVAASVVAQYQGQGLTSTTQVLLSRDPQDFLDRLSTVSQFDDQRSQLMQRYVVQATVLAGRRQAAARQVADIAETEHRLGTEKAQIDQKAGQAKALLATLRERAAQERASRARARTAASTASSTAASTSASEGGAGAATTGPAAPVSGRAAAAVRYAMAQVGKAYVYGAAGPSAFDCSGLTMRAWGAAGVGLPHSSAAQMGSGTPVSESQLQPGDLVFYYSPVSHVGMYIGHGLIVNAENPSVGVKVTGVDSMPYAGAVRPG